MEPYKECSDCGKSSTETAFPPRHGRICRACLATRGRNYYHKNKGNGTLHFERTRKERLDMLSDYLYDRGCLDCGTTDIRVLEFDHVRDKKIMSVSEMLRNHWAWDKIQSEIDKCDIVCANCHRIRTYTRQNSWRIEAHDRKVG
jgi:hypothetical protein